MKLFNHRGQDCLGQLRIFHQSRAFAIVYNLRDRTAHIDINDIIRTFFQPERHIAHDIGIRTEKLCGYRTLFFPYRQDWFRIPVIIKKRVGADHFRTHQAAALLPAQQPEGEIRHSGHGGQCNIVLQFYISYS